MNEGYTTKDQNSLRKSQFLSLNSVENKTDTTVQSWSLNMKKRNLKANMDALNFQMAASKVNTEKKPTIN